jgi:TRAP-type uncharacterized transport system substrate-binding protein
VLHLYDSYLHIIVSKGSVVTHIDQLGGVKLYLGAEESAARRLAIPVLEHYGLHSARIEDCQATSLTTRSSRYRIFCGSGPRPQLR